MNMGKAIADFREAKGMSQQQLAAIAGYGHAYVNVIEKKKLIFHLEPVYVLADALDVKVSELFQRAEQL